MKTYRTLALTFLMMIFSYSLFAQEEIYNEPKKEKENKIVETKKSDELTLNEDDYYTAEDYYEKENNINSTGQFNEKDNQTEEEIYKENHEKNNKRKRNSVGVEVAAEVVIDVLNVALFFVAAFWN